MTKPFFISCSVPSIYYGYDRTNKPVNLSLCKSIAKVQHKNYPDNKGIPAIDFFGCDTKWVYKNESERDADYDRIVNNEFTHSSPDHLMKMIDDEIQKRFEPYVDNRDDVVVISRIFSVCPLCQCENISTPDEVKELVHCQKCYHHYPVKEREEKL